MQGGDNMETAFYASGMVFFLFASAMLAGMNISIGQIAKRMTDDGREK